MRERQRSKTSTEHCANKLTARECTHPLTSAVFSLSGKDGESRAAGSTVGVSVVGDAMAAVDDARGCREKRAPESRVNDAEDGEISRDGATSNSARASALRNQAVSIATMEAQSFGVATGAEGRS